MNDLCRMPVVAQAPIHNKIVLERLDSILPALMAESGLDLWLILCHEDNPDPVLSTLIPFEAWTPILQMLVFCRAGDTLRRINLCGTHTQDWYERPYAGQEPQEQWRALLDLIQELKPDTIGINIGAVQWAASGLSYRLHTELQSRLPPAYKDRLVSAENLCSCWLMTLSPAEIELQRSLVAAARRLIADCYAAPVIQPGKTSLGELRWAFRQEVLNRGWQCSFNPSFTVFRRDAGPTTAPNEIIQAGDAIHCDVGIKFLGLNTDHQEWAYITLPSQTSATPELQRLLKGGNQLQDIFLSELGNGIGKTGNQLLKSILGKAAEAGLPNPMVYSHSLGHFLHEPGPLIGLPWEQADCGPRGEVSLRPDTAFAMELSVGEALPRWSKRVFRLSIEQDVIVTRSGASVLDGRQTAFHLL
jgi:Xaa-Pro aminopeptidase